MHSSTLVNKYATAKKNEKRLKQKLNNLKAYKDFKDIEKQIEELRKVLIPLLSKAPDKTIASNRNTVRLNPVSRNPTPYTANYLLLNKPKPDLQ
mgnify:CR=1 FL=1